MLIVCAGRSRSGSTLMYNLIRLTLVEIFGKANVYSRGIRFYNKNHELKYNIVKLHDSDDSYFFRNADYVFSCQRNEKDQRRSIVKFRKIMKNTSPNKEELNNFIQYDLKRYRKWANHKRFVKTFDYDMLLLNKKQIIKTIINTLDLNTKSDIVTTTVQNVNDLKLPSEKNRIDPESCLTWHHVTGDVK